jgi:hypothetical protein
MAKNDRSANLERVARNVQKMIGQQAPEAHLEAYLKTEGFTADRFVKSMEFYKKTNGDLYQGGPLRSFVQGLSLNSADEIEAGIRSVMPGGKSYSDEVERIREANKDYAAANPYESFSAELAGGAPLMAVPFLGTYRAAKTANQAKTLGQEVMRGAATGGGLGAVGGFNAGENTLSNRLSNAMAGTAFGVTLGGAAPVVTQAASAGGRSLAGKIGLRSEQAAERRADEVILRNLQRDGLTPDQAARALADLRVRGNKPETLADVAGESTLGTMASAQAVPSQSRNQIAESLRNRALGRGDRMADDITNRTGQGRQNVPQMLDDLERQGRSQSDQAYRQAYGARDAIDDDEIMRLLDNPYIGDAFQNAQQLNQTLRTIRQANGEVVPDLIPIVQRNADTGAWQMTGRFPDVRTIDLMQRGLQEQIDALYKAGRGETAAALKQVKNRLTARTGEIVPEYAAARGQFRGRKEIEEALEEGRKALSKDARSIEIDLRDMDPFASQAYLTGARDQLRQMIRTQGDTTDLTRKFQTTEMRDRIRNLFPSRQSFDEFLDDVARESRMVHTERAIQGSRTQPLGQAIDDMNNSIPPSMVMDVAQGNLGSAARQGVQRLAAMGKGIDSDVADQMFPRLLNTDPNANSAYLARLNTLADIVAREQANRTGRRAGYSAAGGIVPSLLTNERD